MNTEARTSPVGRNQAERGGYAFRKEERICHRSDFLRIFQKGAKYQSVHFRASICPNNLSYRRLGITVGKQVGSAVERNRLKRLIREFFRLNRDTLPGSSDLVIVAREGAAGLSYWQVAEELKGMMSRELL